MVETVMTSIMTDEADLLDRKDIRVGVMVGAAGEGRAALILSGVVCCHPVMNQYPACA